MSSGKELRAVDEIDTKSGADGGVSVVHYLDASFAATFHNVVPSRRI